MIKRS